MESHRKPEACGDHDRIARSGHRSRRDAPHSVLTNWMDSRSSAACSQKAPLSDRVIRSPSSLIADVNLQNGRFVSAGPHLEWDDFVASSAELLTDCLKTLQPVGVAVIYGDLKLYSPAQSFDSVRDAIASEPLGGQYKRPPANLAVFEDLSVALVFKLNQTHSTRCRGQ